MSLPHLDVPTWINAALLSLMIFTFLFIVLHARREGGEAICKVAFTTMVLTAIGGFIGLLATTASGPPRLLTVATCIACVVVGIIGAVYAEHVDPRVRWN